MKRLIGGCVKKVETINMMSILLFTQNQNVESVFSVVFDSLAHLSFFQVIVLYQSSSILLLSLEQIQKTSVQENFQIFFCSLAALNCVVLQDFTILIVRTCVLASPHCKFLFWLFWLFFFIFYFNLLEFNSTFSSYYRWQCKQYSNSRILCTVCLSNHQVSVHVRIETT